MSLKSRPDAYGRVAIALHWISAGLIVGLMVAMLVLHVAGALYHQFVLKDRLLARMGIGQ